MKLENTISRFIENNQNQRRSSVRDLGRSDKLYEIDQLVHLFDRTRHARGMRVIDDVWEDARSRYALPPDHISQMSDVDLDYLYESLFAAL